MKSLARAVLCGAVAASSVTLVNAAGFPGRGVDMCQTSGVGGISGMGNVSSDCANGWGNLGGNSSNAMCKNNNYSHNGHQHQSNNNSSSSQTSNTQTNNTQTSNTQTSNTQTNTNTTTTTNVSHTNEICSVGGTTITGVSTNGASINGFSSNVTAPTLTGVTLNEARPIPSTFIAETGGSSAPTVPVGENGFAPPTAQGGGRAYPGPAPEVNEQPTVPEARTPGGGTTAETYQPGRQTRRTVRIYRMPHTGDENPMEIPMWGAGLIGLMLATRLVALSYLKRRQPAASA